MQRNVSQNSTQVVDIGDDNDSPGERQSRAPLNLLVSTAIPVAARLPLKLAAKRRHLTCLLAHYAPFRVVVAAGGIMCHFFFFFFFFFPLNTVQGLRPLRKAASSNTFVCFPNLQARTNFFLFSRQN